MATPFSILRSRLHLTRRIASLEAELRRCAADRDRALAEGEAIRRDAETAVTAKSTYLATLSHEIRTPIHAILGFSALARRMDLPPKAQHYMKLIFKAGENLKDIIDDVLDLSKLEADMMAVDAVAFSLEAVAAQVVNLTGHRAAEKGLEFVVAGLEGLEDTRLGDPLRLGQVLTNLVANAVKFTARGRVAVRFEPVPGRDGAVRFQVEDTGLGMTEAQQRRVFEAFAQADSSTAREFGGTGLGLTIAKRLVEAMGGQLELRSRPGAGSSFTFTLDLPGRPGPAKARSRLKAGARVLVVGTPPATQATLCAQLEAQGFRTHCAGTGEEALQALRLRPDQAPFDLALLAHRMDGPDGIQTARALALNPWLKGLPIVLLVGPLEDEAVALEAEREGIRVLLTLPALPGPLGEAVLHAAEGPALSVLDSGRVWFGAPEVLQEMAGARVLLVDDNAVNRELGVDLLASAGIDAVPAASGAEALALAEGGAFDAVLLDVEMPGMDGWETLARLRARPGGARLPVIALTAHALAGFREQCLAAGMDDYVAKPIELPQLFRVLNRWLPGRGPRARARIPAPAPGRFQALEGVLDVSGTLERLGGDADLLAKTLEAFLRDASRPEQRALEALRGGDPGTARALIHPIRGLAGTLGMTRVAEAAKAAEGALEAGDAGAALAALDHFARGLEAVRGAVADFLRIP